jgi:transcriptional regulator with XRE-family HTH domain
MSREKKKSRISVNWHEVGRRLRELRGFDLTQSEIAERIGVSQGYLSSVERGEREVGAEILLRIAYEFDKSIEWILTGN